MILAAERNWSATTTFAQAASQRYPPPLHEVLVAEGETYYIRIAGWSGNTGTYSLNIRPCANACCREDGLCGHREQAFCEATETNTFHGPNSLCLGDFNNNNIDDICEQTPDNWLWKDYNGDNPGGYLPDFDQNKDYDNADGDQDPTTGVDAFYGGPTAAADLLVFARKCHRCCCC